MKRKIIGILFLVITAGIIILSIWGPEEISGYKDKSILNQIHIQTVEKAGQSYRYTLSSEEKLLIVSQALSSQNQQTAGNYAFVLNYNEPEEKEITSEAVYDRCNQEIAVLQELGILPGTVKPVDEEVYDAVLYTAIDVLEPRNHVAVWKLSVSNLQQNIGQKNRIIDIYLDADTGKVFQFYARTEYEWEDIDTDFIMTAWSQYIELEAPATHEPGNPLMETTPYFNNYAVTVNEVEKTVVTIGFYEGINELFLKVS